MAKLHPGLRSRLQRGARKRGAVAFGVASSTDIDSQERMKINDSGTTRWSKRPKDLMPSARSAVVFGISATDDFDELAVRRHANEWVYPGYNPLAHIARDMIEILDAEGFAGMVPPESVPRKPIAVLAGLGAYGKNSMILSEKHGLSLRLEVVLTDALLVWDEPFKKDLCKECARCVESCPAKAIIKPYVLDPHRCFVHIDEMGTRDDDLREVYEKHARRLTPNTNVMCTICQMACPYTPTIRRRNVVSRTATTR